MNREMLAGVIGLGVVAKTHLKILRTLPGVRLAAGCDRDPQKSSMMEPDEAFYTDYREMLRVQRLDAVHICLPHYLHQPVAEYCAAAGVNVLSEKPEAVTGEQLERMEMLEERYGVKVGICLQNRFNRTTKMLMDIVKGGQYGSVRGVKGIVTWNRPLEYYEAAPWRGDFARSGGGCMMNQSIHTLDLMQLIGGPIASIKGSVCRWMDYPTEVEDTAGARICFESGACGIFFATVGYVDNSSVDLEVVCDGAVLNIKDYKLSLRTDDGECRIICGDDKMDERSYYGAGHLALIKDFYDCVSGKGGERVNCTDGAVSVRMIHRIYESALKGQVVRWKMV